MQVRDSKSGAHRPGNRLILPNADRLLFGFVEFLAIACLAALAILCLFQVLTRFVINLPSVWTEPAIRMLLVWSTFLGVTMLARRGVLISITFLRDRATGWFAQFLSILALVSGTIFFGCAAWFGFNLVGRVKRQVLSGLDISIAWAYLAIPAGAMLCLLALILYHLRVNEDEDDVARDASPDDL